MGFMTYLVVAARISPMGHSIGVNMKSVQRGHSPTTANKRPSGRSTPIEGVGGRTLAFLGSTGEHDKRASRRTG